MPDMTNLRWFVTCDEFGRRTEPVLQYWDPDIELWRDVPYVECKKKDEWRYMNTEEPDL